MIRQTADKFILFSGGAIGADTVFGSNAEFYGITEQNYSFRHHKTCRSRGRVILNSDQLELANHDLLNVVGEVFRKHQESGSLAEKYWQRNWYQVRQTKEIFAVVKNIASLLDFAVEKIEGTAIGIALAIKLIEGCKQIYIYEQASKSWFVWKRNKNNLKAAIKIKYRKIDLKTKQPEEEILKFEKIEEDEVRITESEFTGIGTREIIEDGINAINRLFERSF